jgi:predicted PurR-regulated permease PerM
MATARLQPRQFREPTDRDTSRVITTVVVLALAYSVLLIVRPFATALVFAVVMVVVFWPLHTRLERRLRPSVAAALSTVAVVLVIVVPAVLIADRIVNETLDLAGNVRTLPFDALLARVQGHAAAWGLDLERILRDGAQQVAGQAGLLTSRVITNTWALFMGVIVSILAMFFLFRDGTQLLAIVTRVMPISAAITGSWVDNISGMIRSNIAASLVAASIQGTIGGLAFAWFSLPAPVLWGVVMGFFCVFPFIGAWLVWGPAAVALALANRPWDAALMAVTGLAVVHPVDNLLRPAIVAHTTKLNGLLVLIGLIGGVQAFGASGLLLGPVLVSVAVGLLRTAADER